MLKTPVGSNDHSLGPDDAPVTITEYADFECPYCKDANELVRTLGKKFHGKLRYVFRHYPLEDIHPNAMLAALAAEAAGEQGKFWEMHATLFEAQGDLTGDLIVEAARYLELDIEKFEEAIKSERLLKKIDAQRMDGDASGVDGTPTFYINGDKLDEQWDEKVLSWEIDEIIKADIKAA